MGFASDDNDDDIYDSKHSLKDLQTWLEKDFDTIINIKIILLIYSITDINQSRWRNLEASPFTSFFN